MTTTNQKVLGELLSRGVEKIFVKDNLRKRLQSGRPLRVKFGIDPTGPNLHLGNAVPLRKLRAFQELGHRVVLVVGDFTAEIGDPSDKLKRRPMLTSEKVRENMRTYKKQLAKIIDLKNAEIHYNSKWLKRLTLKDSLRLADSFTVQQMLERRNFRDRHQRGDEISLREFFYPLLQGYDSVAVGADVEIGGFDQLFNLEAGRIVQRHFNRPPQDILTTSMLLGTDGRKMSKSWGNVININDSPAEMFGRVMSLRDELIADYFYLCTDVEALKIDRYKKELKRRATNPRDLKLELAETITRLYHGETAALKAGKSFSRFFQKRQLPAGQLESFEAKKGSLLSGVLLAAGLVKSKSELRRLLAAGAIDNLENQKTITSDLPLGNNTRLRVGKKKFVQIKIKP